MFKSVLVFAIASVLILGTFTATSAFALPNLPDDLPEVSKAPEKVRVIEGENLIAYAKAHYTSMDNPLNHQSSSYPGVAKLYLPSISTGWTYGCSGALLTDGLHVLTAAHCVTDSNGVDDLDLNKDPIAVFGNEQVSIIDYIVHPDYDGDYIKGNDIAILKLSNSPSGISGYNYATNDNQVGSVVSKVGYGISGYFDSGANADSYPFGTKRDGLNKYDAFGDTMYNALGLNEGSDYISEAVYQFDSDDGSGKHDAFGYFFGISDKGLGDDEVNSASGDSGGPTFNSDGEITGITSYGITLQYTNRQTSDCTKAFGGPVLDSSCGEFSGDTRVSFYSGWISATIGNGSPNPTSPQAVNDFYSTPFETNLNISGENGVLNNDSGDNLTASLASGPSNGDLTLNSDGSFEYIPNFGFHGDDSFIYQISGDGGSDTATATITVEAPTTIIESKTTILPIEYEGTGGKNSDKHLNVILTLVDNVSDSPIAGSSVSITLSNGQDSWTGSGTTESNGKVAFSLKNAPSGTYTTTVDSVISDPEWDGIQPDDPEYTK